MKKIILFIVGTTLLPGSLFASNEGTRYLVLGDSHCAGKFGETLDSLLNNTEKVQVSFIGSCGSAPVWFYNGTKTHCGYFEHHSGEQQIRVKEAPTPLIENLLKMVTPGFTVVALGSNLLPDIDTTAGFKTAEKQVRRMVESILRANSRCVWVGPPSMRRFGDSKIAKFYSILKSEAKQCVVLDSRKYVTYPKSGADGVHYDALPQLADKWAKGVYSDLVSLN